MYKETQPAYGQTEATSVIRTADNAYIPFAADNTDYQAYLAWLAEGNTPIEADA